MASFFLYHEGGEQLFCENETNNQRMYNRPNDSPFVKDGINNYIVNNENTVNLKKKGTKAAIWLKERIRPGAIENIQGETEQDRNGRSMDRVLKTFLSNV